MTEESSPLKVYGFTGSRAGMTLKQQATLRVILRDAYEMHNGSARGADELAALIAFRMGISIIAHPAQGVHPSDRVTIQATITRRAQPPLVRNKTIVTESEVMIATPQETAEDPPGGPPRGSGTWATIRETRRQRKPLIIIWPDGNITNERYFFND